MRRAARMHRATGMACALAGGIFWGFSGVCGQYLFEEKAVTAAWLVPVRLLVSGLLLLAYFLAADRTRTLRIWKTRQNRKELLIYAVAGMMLCQYAYFQTIEWSNAGTATVIQYLGPAMIVVYVCLSARRRPQKKEVAAVLLALGGIFLIATHGDPGSLALSGRALAMGLVSAAALVVYSVAPQRLMREFSAPLILAWGMVIGGVILTLLMRPWRHTPMLDLQALAVLFLIITLGTIASFSLYMHSVHLIGAVLAGLFASIEPVSATVLSVLWMHVDFSLADLAGFALILATVAVLALPGKRRGAV